MVSGGQSDRVVRQVLQLGILLRFKVDSGVVDCDRREDYQTDGGDDVEKIEPLRDGKVAEVLHDVIPGPGHFIDGFGDALTSYT